jgi:hypothetical protein
MLRSLAENSPFLPAFFFANFAFAFAGFLTPLAVDFLGAALD